MLTRSEKENSRSLSLCRCFHVSQTGNGQVRQSTVNAFARPMRHQVHHGEAGKKELAKLGTSLPALHTAPKLASGFLIFLAPTRWVRWHTASSSAACSSSAEEMGRSHTPHTSASTQDGCRSGNETFGWFALRPPAGPPGDSKPSLMVGKP